MTAIKDLPYPLSLCVQLLHHAAWGCVQTQDKTASEICAAAGQFFDEATIAEAQDVLCGRSTKQYGCPHKWIDLRTQVIESGEACLECGTIRSGNIKKEPT